MNVIEINFKDKKYPQRLLHIKNFPPKIFVLGNTDLLNKNSTLAIVGSRKCSNYGIKVTNEFAYELSKKDICIISGMAIGIDGIAHNAAISECGKTIAVLGSGFNHIYPPENEWLFHKILEKGGCIISEYSPETKPDKSKFPTRNRIISGISDGVLVVEALPRSGSTITAKYAKQEKKPVYAIPNSIYSTTSCGTNKLIKEGAILITKPSQIIESLNKLVPSKIPNNSNQSNLSNTSKCINTNSIIPNEYLEIYMVLSEKPIHINEIAKILNTPFQEISPILTLMEIDGYAYQPLTNYFTRKTNEFD